MNSNTNFQTQLAALKNQVNSLQDIVESQRSQLDRLAGRVDFLTKNTELETNKGILALEGGELVSNRQMFNDAAREAARWKAEDRENTKQLIAKQGNAPTKRGW